MSRLYRRPVNLSLWITLTGVLSAIVVSFITKDRLPLQQGASIGWIIATNVWLFLTYAIDKGLAGGKRRVPEVQFLLFNLLAGGPGGLSGMLIFRHKTRKPLFWFTIMIGWIGFIAWILWLAS